MQRGVSEEVFEQNKEALYAQSHQVATRDLKLQIILAKIALKEEIKVGDEDLSQAVYRIAMQQRRDVQEIVKELQGDRNRVLQLQRQILFQKTLDFLVNEATVTDASAEPNQA
jgi:trigger factor